jgi:hypothetical protein
MISFDGFQKGILLFVISITSCATSEPILASVAGTGYTHFFYSSPATVFIQFKLVLTPS